jgi:hypothetical protein
MIGVVGDAEFAFEDGGNAPACPDVSEEPERFGPATEQRWHARQLRVRQARPLAPARLRAQGIHPLISRRGEPLAHGPGRHAERLGDSRLRPALLVQLPSPPPASLPPADGGRSSGHVWTP